MSFWSNLQLWEKLSIVLVGSILLTFIGSFCVLAYKRWRTRRYTVIEAQQKLEEADVFPMMDMDDIPFGARALERGHHVEGVWVGTLNAPIAASYQPGAAHTSRSSTQTARSSTYTAGTSISVIRPCTVRPPSTLQLETISVPSSPPSFSGPATHIEKDDTEAFDLTDEYYRASPLSSHAISSSAPGSSSNLNRRSDAASTSGKRVSILKRASHLLHTNSTADLGSGELEMGTGEDHDLNTPPEETQSRRHSILMRRNSSDEFKRRMSKIFNDRIHMNIPAERLQFNPELQDSRRRAFRRSILGAFRESE